MNTKSDKKKTRNEYKYENQYNNLNETDDLDKKIFWCRVLLYIVVAVLVVQVIVLVVNYFNTYR